MTDFSNALLSLREPMTRAPKGNARAEALLTTREAIFSSSPLSNPMLAATKVTDWPDAGLLKRLGRGAQRRGNVVSPGAYCQLAFPAETAPSRVPSSVTLLGFDVTDGCDSYLLDYGDWPTPLDFPEEELNAVGLMDRQEAAEGLAERLRHAWELGPDDEPQAWALYRVATPT